MKPTDFPVERLAALQNAILIDATGMVSAARRTDDNSQARGYYEAAFAYHETAHRTKQVTDSIIADLDRAAAQEADPHTWPIPDLVNTDDETERRRPTAHRERWPVWGVPVEGYTEQAHLSVGVGADGGEILVWIFDKLADGPAPREHVLHVEIHHWRALNKLVERIAAGHPVPYNLHGAVRTEL